MQLRDDEPDERLVRGAVDGRCGDPDPEDPVAHAVDAIGAAAWREADGDADAHRGRRSPAVASRS
jgi:hypothetical protein